MITNIVDRRANPYSWKAVDAIIEMTWHDNVFAKSGGDRAEPDYRDPNDEKRTGISVADAVAWAMSFEGALTLYLYDEGGIKATEIKAGRSAISR